MSLTTATNQNNGQFPKIKMYTNHGCGWCHRVQIVLKELGLPYEEVLVDLDNARPEWFLKMNPVSTDTRPCPLCNQAVLPCRGWAIRHFEDHHY